MIICARCGNENPEDNNFCEQCGTKFSSILDVSDVDIKDIDPIEYFFPKRKKRPPMKRTKDSVVCPKCRGAGRVQEQVQSLFGATMMVKECPECLGYGFINPEGDSH